MKMEVWFQGVTSKPYWLNKQVLPINAAVTGFFCS